MKLSFRICKLYTYTKSPRILLNHTNIVKFLISLFTELYLNILLCIINKKAILERFCILNYSTCHTLLVLWQFVWTSLVAQLVKNMPTMQETWVWSLGWDPGEGKGYPLQYSGLDNSLDCTVHSVPKSWTRLSDFHYFFLATL